MRLESFVYIPYLYKLILARQAAQLLILAFSDKAHMIQSSMVK